MPRPSRFARKHSRGAGPISTQFPDTVILQGPPPRHSRLHAAPDRLLPVRVAPTGPAGRIVRRCGHQGTCLQAAVQKDSRGISTGSRRCGCRSGPPAPSARPCDPYPKTHSYRRKLGFPVPAQHSVRFRLSPVLQPRNRRFFLSIGIHPNDRAQGGHGRRGVCKELPGGFIAGDNRMVGGQRRVNQVHVLTNIVEGATGVYGSFNVVQQRLGVRGVYLRVLQLFLLFIETRHFREKLVSGSVALPLLVDGGRADDVVADRQGGLEKIAAVFRRWMGRLFATRRMKNVSVDHEAFGFRSIHRGPRSRELRPRRDSCFRGPSPPVQNLPANRRTRPPRPTRRCGSWSCRSSRRG